MQRKHKRELFFAVIVIIALLVLLWWLMRADDTPRQVREDQLSVEEVETDQNGEQVIPVSDLPSQPETVTRVFVERFGSFSSESGYENIDAILALATPELQNRLEIIAEDARRRSDAEYYGVSTRLISLQEVSASDSEKIHTVMTQREEAFGSPGNTSVRYQEIHVTLVQGSNGWLVGDFVWSE